MPTLEVSIEEGKLIAGLLNAERAQNKVDAAIKKTVATSKAWEEENKKQAAAELRRRTEMIRMREADEAAQKRAHQERHQMYVQLFADQDKQRRNIEQIIASERRYAAAMRESAQAAGRAAQAAGMAGLRGYGPRGQDPVSAGFAQWNQQQSAASSATASARARANAAFAASQAAAQAQVSGFGLNNGQPLPPHLQNWSGAMNPMAAFVAYKAGKAPPQSPEAIKAAAAAQEKLAAATARAKSMSDMASGALNGVAGQLAGVASAAAAIALVKEGMEFGHGQRVGGAQAIKSDFQIMREISEVSEAGQAGPRYQKYLDLKQQLGPQTAWGLLEKGIATGNEGSVDYFAANRGAMDPALAMSVGSHLETLFKGSVTEREGANMALEASRKSRWTVGEFAPSLPTAASGGQLGGSTAAETLAIQSVMSDVFKSPEQAADYLRYAGTRGGRMDGLKSKGKGVLAMMTELSDMPLEDRRRSEFAGERIEFNTFIEQVALHREDILKRQAEIELAQQRSGGPGSNLAVGHREFMSLPGAPELLKNQTALGAEEESLRDAFGSRQLTMESARSGVRTYDVNRGAGAAERFVRNKATWVAEMVDASPESVPAVAGAASTVFGGGIDWMMRMVGLQAEANKTLKEIKDKPVPRPAPNPNGGGRR